MAYRLCERTKLRRGLTPRSYQVTARLAVDAVWATSRSSRQIIPKAFQPVSFAAKLGPKWPGDIIAVSSWNARERRADHEEVPVRAGADRLRVAAGGEWNTRGGGLSKDGHLRADLLPVEEEFVGMGVAEVRRLKVLEEENRKFKQLVADLSLDKQMLQDVLRKKP